MLTTGNQLRAARALIGMDAATLAGLAGTDEAAIAAMEALGAERLRGDRQVLEAVAQALRQAGVTLIDDGRPGVRLSAAGARDEGLRPSELDATNDD